MSSRLFSFVFNFLSRNTAPISYFIGLLAIIIKLPKYILKPSSFNLEPRTIKPPLLREKALGKHLYFEIPEKKYRIHYVSTGNDSKQLLLFIHGFPDCWLSWKHQIEEFKKDYWVVTLDLPGYGESDKPIGYENYSMDEISSDLRHLINHLGKKPIIISHDFGGAASWYLLRQDSSIALKHIAINSPDVKLFAKTIRSNIRQFCKSWYVFFFDLPKLPEIIVAEDDLNFINKCYKNIASDEEIECIKYYFSQPGALTSAINYYRALVANYKRTLIPKAKLNSTISTPTLVIWGMKDIALEPEIGTAVTSFVQDVKVEQLQHLNHWSHREDPVKVNQLIRNFIQTNS